VSKLIENRVDQTGGKKEFSDRTYRGVFIEAWNAGRREGKFYSKEFNKIFIIPLLHL